MRCTNCAVLQRVNVVERRRGESTAGYKREGAGEELVASKNKVGKIMRPSLSFLAFLALFLPGIALAEVDDEVPSSCDAKGQGGEGGCEASESTVSRLSSSERYKLLRKNIAEIKEVCGEICDTTIKGKQVSKNSIG